MAIDIGPAMKQLQRDFNTLQRQQVPFASALALTRIAKNVQAAETDALSTVFDRPTPFTRKAFVVTPATKRTLTARVSARPIQAKYLAPSETGGRQVLGSKRAILAPRGVGLNAYGNLPRTKLATLKAKSTVFIGSPRGRKGSAASGVWQRVGKGRSKKLKLLIQFADPAPIQPVFGFDPRARSVVARTYQPEFEAAMAQALSTGR
jgi:hypothetical protein